MHAQETSLECKKWGKQYIIIKLHVHVLYMYVADTSVFIVGLQYK